MAFGKPFFSSKRNEYLNDYQKDATGRYVYTGVLYKYGHTKEKTRRRAYTEIWLLSIGAFAAVLACGFIRIPGMSGCPYVLMPYALALILSGSVIWTMGNLTYAGDPIERRDYDTVSKKFSVRALIAGICAGVAAVGEIVFLILNGLDGNPLAGAVIFIVLQCVAAVFGIVVRSLIGGITWSKNK